MFVGSRFDGDNNKTLMDVQHDMYGDMVGWLYGSARRRYLESAMLLRVENELVEALRDKTTFDHRRLQEAHDVIAAYYRFARDDGGQLRFEEKADDYRLRLRRSWDRFFRFEVRSLVQDDEMVVAILTAAAFNPNRDQGYAAETTLKNLLGERYEEMFNDPSWH